MRIGLVAAAVSQNTRALAEAWRRERHDVIVVTRHGTRWRDDIPVHALAAGGRAGKLGFLHGGAARRILRAAGAEVVVGYHITSYGLLAARTGLRPLALVAAGGDILPEQYGAWHRRVLMPPVARYVIGRADRIVSWAPHMTARMVELGADPGRIFTLPRGIDLARFHAPGREFDLGRRPPRIISTRGLKPLYRVDVLVRALALVPGALLTVFGDGPQRPALERLVAELGVGDRVRLKGMRPYEEIADSLREADLFVSLTASDGVSASLLEALATGCFPILSNIAAARIWIEDGRNGLLVDGDSPEDVAGAIVRAAQDEALRRAAAASNREQVERRGDLYGNAAAIGRELETLVASHASVVASPNALRRATSASSEKSRSGSNPGRT